MEDWRRGKQNNGEINGSVIHPCLLIFFGSFSFFFPLSCYFFSPVSFSLRGSDAAHEPSLPSCQLSSISLGRPTGPTDISIGTLASPFSSSPEKGNKKKKDTQGGQTKAKSFDRASVSLSKTNLQPGVQQVILQWVSFSLARECWGRHEKHVLNIPVAQCNNKRRRDPGGVENCTAHIYIYIVYMQGQ